LDPNISSATETNKPVKKTRTRRIIVALWVFFAIAVAGIAIFFTLVYNGAVGYMPDIESLKNPTDKYASVIYSADGEELGRYFRPTGNRVYADYSDISQNVIDALIATEDARFMEHSGIDLKAIFRAVTKTIILRQKNAGGGSTITQQLAKQLYSPRSSGLMERAMQKPIEWMIAVKLERFYSKEEIIKMYLNQFDFLYNAVGIRSAAWVYFGKDASDLSVNEAATLIGMVKNPSYFNPVRKNERTRDRRNVVLQQMEKAGFITKAECDSLSSLPLVLDYHKVDHKEGLAPYFREELRRMLTAKKPQRSNYMAWENQKFTDDSIAWATNPLYGWIEKNPKADGSHYDIYTDGLKIYTTIDSRMQQYAEEAVAEHLGGDLQKAFFQAPPPPPHPVGAPIAAPQRADKPRHQAKRAFPADEARRALRGGDNESFRHADGDENLLLFRSGGHGDDPARQHTAREALSACRIHGHGSAHGLCESICGRTEFRRVPV